MSIQINGWAYPNGVSGLSERTDQLPRDADPIASLLAGELVELLSRVIRCAAGDWDYVRPGYAVNGVHLAVPQGMSPLTASATDGRSHAVQEICVQPVRVFGSLSPATAIPSAAAKLILRTAREWPTRTTVHVYADATGFWFVFPDGEIAVDYLPGKFPDLKCLLSENERASGVARLFTPGTILPHAPCDLLIVELEGRDIRLRAEISRPSRYVVARWNGKFAEADAKPFRIVLDARRLRRLLSPLPAGQPIDFWVREPGGFVEIATGYGFTGYLMPIVAANAED